MQNPYDVTTEDNVPTEARPTAEVSLTDCLACSGCVTSAEAVLVSLQSHAEVLNTLDAHPEMPLVHGQNGTTIGSSKAPDRERIFVATVSPQVRASLAATYGISEREATYMVDQFLSGPQGLRAGGEHGSGFTWVVDTNAMREAVRVLTADEVGERLASMDSSDAASPTTPLPKRPILSSSCPGWICYAEKTHPFIIPHLSRLKSPQALSGTLLKTVLSKVLGVSPSQIWHVAVMPCFDKKLEASREELTDVSWRPTENQNSETHTPVRDVDCVITARELLMLASSRGISLSRLPLHPLTESFIPPFPDKTVGSFLFSKEPRSKQTLSSGTSGGYFDNVLATFQAQNPGSKIEHQRSRADVVDYVLMSAEGRQILRAGRYYGFKNIQNLVRKLKPDRLPKLPGANVTVRRSGGNRGQDYDYVEVMACPGGCTNGGGQLRVEDAREIRSDKAVSSSSDDVSEAPSQPTRQEQRDWLKRVDEAYFSADSGSDTDMEDRVAPSSIAETEAKVHEMLQYWAELIRVPLAKLVYTSYREVVSDVGKPKGPDTNLVAELITKAGNGW